MTDLEETIKRNEAVIAEMSATIRDAKSSLEQYQRFLDENGLSAESIQRFLESPHVTPEEREDIRAKVAEMQESFEAEMATALEQIRQQATAGRVSKVRTRNLV